MEGLVSGMTKTTDSAGQSTPRSGDARPVGVGPATIEPKGEEGRRNNGAGTTSLLGLRATIGLGIVAVVLLGFSVVLWTKLSARDTSLGQAKNRTDQMAAGVVVLQASLTEAKNETSRILKQKIEADTETAQAKTDLATAKAGAIELQEQLETSRAGAVRFQAQGEESKVASIKHQGEAELARTQAAVAKTQLAQAKAELAEREKQRAEDTAELAALRTRLDRTETELAAARKSPVKK